MCNTNNYDPAIIAEKIKKECMRQNITVKTMLQELSMGVNAIQQISKGQMPRLDTIARICDYLHISIDDLLSRAAPIPTDNAPQSVDLAAAIDTVAAAAHISPAALRAVLHLQDDK